VSILINLKSHHTHPAYKIPIEDDTRFEFKYRLTYFQYLKIRNAIRPYMVMDPYTSDQASSRYLVRSLYFDTYNYRCFHQKMSGDSHREKFRFRTYPYGQEYMKELRVELKIREGNISKKTSVFIPIEEYLHFMNKRHWQSFDNPITKMFEYRLLTNHLKPIMLVEYDREGYQTRISSNLRITFDHRVCASHSQNLFPEKAFYRYLYPRAVVMEIKFKKDMPLWLESVVRGQGMQVIANSKYAQSLQIARHDLYHPNSVILVR